MSVDDLEPLEETLDILSTPGALDQIRQAEDEIARGQALDADQVRRLLAERQQVER
jgi:antitoxin YefM